jgi:hypothetical protein
MRWKSGGRHSVRLTSVLDLLLAQHRPQRLVLPNAFDAGTAEPRWRAFIRRREYV